VIRQISEPIGVALLGHFPELLLDYSVCVGLFALKELVGCSQVVPVFSEWSTIVVALLPMTAILRVIVAPAPLADSMVKRVGGHYSTTYSTWAFRRIFRSGVLSRPEQPFLN
jgi:hypothetical protein